jgi:light-regulated signal transduction histidine kinase (bacteriophytochrome)
VFDASGVFTGYIGVGTDITERRNHQAELQRLNASLEQRVRDRTRALEVANRELESFSYSVSHDLRAPLRAINGFSQLLEQQCAPQLNDDCRNFVTRIRAGSERMGHLIEDLLSLSRLSRQPMHSGVADLSALVRELAEELTAADANRRVEWVIAPDIRADGDGGLLRVVLQNLVGNAWKYSSRRDAARIEFGVTTQHSRPVYFVRDNGAGFDMTYADKLFTAFQRLHSSFEFPGTGIGLATVARIVHRHGGEIWAEGQVDAGATFYFTLGTQGESDAAATAPGDSPQPGSGGVSA